MTPTTRKEDKKKTDGWMANNDYIKTETKQKKPVLRNKEL